MIYCLNCSTENHYHASICTECSYNLNHSPVGDIFPEVVLSNRYRLISLLKAGGMGSVYAAKDLRLNSICAIKELFLHFMSSEEKDYRLKSFKSEVDILARLRHPNLPCVTDYFLENEKYYLVMDYVDGEDLESILAKKGNPGLDEKEVVKWGMTICDVLDYLHSYKPQILYRDLKPSNIMLRFKDNRLILVDFGVAKIIKEEKKLQTAIGTEGYSPPEQYEGKSERGSDIYSLGATLHHLLTGVPPLIPFEFKPIREIDPKFSEKLETILMNSLKRKVNERYETALKMKEELQPLLVEYEKPKNFV